MGFFSGGTTTSTTDQYSGLRGVLGQKSLANFAKLAPSNMNYAFDTIKGRVNEANPFNIGSNGLTDAQNEAFKVFGQQLFGQHSSGYAARGLVSPENTSAVIGSSLTSAAPQLMQQVYQNQLANEQVKAERFNALNALLSQYPGMLGSESHSTYKQTGPNLLASAVSGWASPQGWGSFLSGLGNLGNGGGVKGIMG